MRTKILSLALLTVTAAAASLRADPPATSDFDFKKINDVIKEAMDQVVADSDLFAKFTYVIDPQDTNLAEDRYAVNMEVVGRDLWADETLSAKLIVSRDTVDSKGRLNVSADVAASTDTLAFIRHHAENSRVCDKQAQVSGALRVAFSEDCKVTPLLAKVQSFDELHQIMKDHIDAAKLAMSGYHADLVKANAVVENDITRQAIQREIDEAARYLKSASDVKLTRTVDGLQISIKEFPILGMAELKNIEADFSPTKIKLKGSGSFGFCKKIFKAAKPELLQILGDLEKGEEYVKILTQMETRFWLRLMEQHVSIQ